MSKCVAKKLAEAIGMVWHEDEGYEHDDCLTEQSRRKIIAIAAKAVQEAANLFLKEQHQSAEETPEQNREEVTGLSTKGKSANCGNSGFSGGCMKRLAAALSSKKQNPFGRVSAIPVKAKLTTP